MKTLASIFQTTSKTRFALLTASLFLTSCCSKLIVVTSYAGSGAIGNTDGPGNTATFAQPVDVAADGKGNIYVADEGNNSIRVIKTNRMVGLFYYWAARPSGGFVAVRTLDADKKGRLFVVDGDNLSLRKIEGGESTTITGFRHDDEFYYTYLSVDGAPDSASFFNLDDLTLNATGDLLYAIDRIPTSCIIRRTTMAGFVTTLTGYPPGCYSSITMDGLGNTYLAQGSKVLKITSTGTASVLAGNATSGYLDGIGTNARFNGITSIDADAKGNVYVSDNGNNRIRKITNTGQVTTIAGNGTAGFANGPGANAQFNDLQGIVVYKCALYVADRGNNRIRKITIPK
jgi:hypothetical protein